MIQVDKKDFIQLFRGQKEKHQADHKAAMKKYKVEVVKAMKDNIKAIQDGTSDGVEINLPKPVANISEYSRLQSYFKAMRGDKIELTIGRNVVTLQLV